MDRAKHNTDTSEAFGLKLCWEKIDSKVHKLILTTKSLNADFPSVKIVKLSNNFKVIVGLTFLLRRI